MKNSSRLFVSIFLVVISSHSAAGGIGDWKSITNKSSIEDLLLDGEWMLCATNGGVLVLDKNDGSVVTSFTNTEGLSDNHPLRIVVDRQQRWWVGMSNGDLDLYDPQTQEWRVFSDFKRFTIHDLVLKGDSLFVALDIGLSVFLLDKYEAKETYKNLGKIPVEVDVYTSFIQEPFIWVGTDHGIAYADLNQVNLKAPQSWKNLSVRDGLASNKVRAIQYFHGSFFIGTDLGIQRYRDGVWTTYSRLPENPVVEFFASENTLYVALNRYVYRYNETLDAWSQVFVSPQINTALFVDPRETIWIGTQSRGIYRWDGGNQTLVGVKVDAPNGNYFSDLALDANGELWCASGALFGKGVYRFDGTSWSNYTAARNDFPIDNTTAVAVDRQNRVWIGSWGRGVYRFINGRFDVFDAQNGVLPGIPSDLGYAVVNRLVVDHTGTVWMTNFAAFNGNKLTAFTPDSQWVYFGQADGILTANPLSITVDRFNRKWVGTDGGGIYVYDDNSTPADKSDDQIAGYLDQSDGLAGNTITALAVDEFNTVWIGTNDGLNFYQDGRVFTKYGLITNDIHCIVVDPVGNKWIGTSSGFSILDRDELTFTHFTIDNSPLVSENVLSITFDKKTGTAFIGTSNGLSLFETLFIEPKESPGQLFVYPNPFVISQDVNDRVLIIDQLCRDCEVNVYDASGFRVRRLVQRARSGRAIWDGRDDEGQVVASGVYLIVAVQNDGRSTSTKVAVIRE